MLLVLSPEPPPCSLIKSENLSISLLGRITILFSFQHSLYGPMYTFLPTNIHIRELAEDLAYAARLDPFMVRGRTELGVGGEGHRRRREGRGRRGAGGRGMLEEVLLPFLLSSLSPTSPANCRRSECSMPGPGP
jgi:hypothetical protein